MASISETELRSNLANYMDKVCDSREPLFVTRQDARNLVLMPADEYEGLVETVHLLQSPNNAARLMRSFRDADQGKLNEHDLIAPDA